MREGYVVVLSPGVDGHTLVQLESCWPERRPWSTGLNFTAWSHKRVTASPIKWAGDTLTFQRS